MKRISGREWLRDYAAAFHSVFQGVDSFDEPLASEVKNRELWAPVYYTLSVEQFGAVCAVAAAVGDVQICVSVTEEFESGSGLTATHWIFESWEYAEYEDEPSFRVLENAVYSPSGKWGILFSHEQHAIVGGSPEFMSTLTREYPDLTQSTVEFLRYWSDVSQRHGTSVKWVPLLLAHIYGREQAKILLAKAGL